MAAVAIGTRVSAGTQRAPPSPACRCAIRLPSFARETPADHGPSERNVGAAPTPRRTLAACGAARRGYSEPTQNARHRGPRFRRVPRAIGKEAEVFRPRATVVSLRAARGALLAVALALLAFAAGAADAPAPGPSGAGTIDTERLFRAIVKVTARAVPDAHSEASLGQLREGTGVVIGADGLVLTIGYLIVEADEVEITDERGRTLPAQILAYDPVSGLGLLRSLVPLDLPPIALGNSDAVDAADPMLIVSAAGEGTSFAFVVSTRPYVGNAEYQLDRALYTSPPMLTWSGAALIDRDGKLVGVGALMVREATEEAPRLPGNVFVPVDLLKPVLAELVRDGRRSGPPRPWLGIAADEVEGHLLVTRVSPDSPADRAGLAPGVVILGVGSAHVASQTEFYRHVWSSGHAGDEITLEVQQGAEVHRVTVRSIERQQYFRPRTMV
jgi:S1-C subfamily serine protease